LQSAASTSAVAPPSAERLAFPDPHHIRSRDVFRLFTSVWPFIRPYRRHVMFLILTIVPALPAGLLALMISRIFFDVIGNGHRLTSGEALMVHVPLGASRETVLLHLIVVATILGAILLPLGALAFAYAVWILQRITNLFRVDLYARLQELSLRFHGEEKIGDADVPGFGRDPAGNRRADPATHRDHPLHHRGPGVARELQLADGIDPLARHPRPIRRRDFV
jgi:hypothetical protein